MLNASCSFRRLSPSYGHSVDCASTHHSKPSRSLWPLLLAVILGATLSAPAQAQRWKYPPGPPYRSCSGTPTIFNLENPDTLQAPCHPATLDTVVGVRGVVIGFDARPSAYGFYIQNTFAGGPKAWTGVDVFTGGTNYNASPYSLALGDSVEVTGTTQEFPNPNGTTEIEGPDALQSTNDIVITKIASGHALPAPKAATTHDFNWIPSSPGNIGEQWEGCLVRINGPLKVARVATGAGVQANNFLIVNPSSPSDSVMIDGFTLFLFGTPPLNTNIDFVQGILNQSTGAGVNSYRIQLRDANDIALAAPPNLMEAYPLEDNKLRLLFDKNLNLASAQNAGNYSLGSGLSGSTVNNATLVGGAGTVVELTITTVLSDGDAETITAQNIGTASCPTCLEPSQTLGFAQGVISIAIIQAPDPAHLSPCDDRSRFAGAGANPGTRLTVRGVAVQNFGALYYIEDAAGGPRSGISIFAPSAPLTNGHRYRIACRAQEFGGETELANTVDIFDEGIDGVPAPSVQSVNDLSDSSCDASQVVNTGEDWEGDLIRVLQVRVVNWNTQPMDPSAGGSFRVVQDAGGGAPDTIVVSNLGNHYTYDPTAGDTLNVTGILHSLLGAFVILPRGDEDLSLVSNRCDLAVGWSFERRLMLSSFYFRKPGDGFGPGELSIDWEGRPTTTIFKKSGAIPATSGEIIRKIHRARRKCEDGGTGDKTTCDGHTTSPRRRKCHWKDPGSIGQTYTDWAVEQEWCPDLQMEYRFYDWDRPFKKAAKNVADVVQKAGECYAGFKKGGDPLKALGSCAGVIGALGTLLDEWDTEVFKKADDIGKVTNAGTTIPLFTSPTAPPGSTLFKECESRAVTSTVKDKAARAEFVWEIERFGDGARAGLPSCLRTVPNLSLCIDRFEFGQVHGVIHFRAIMRDVNLRDGATFSGNRVIYFVLDTDGDKATGAPDYPFCGADVQLKLVMTYTGGVVAAQAYTYRWRVPIGGSSPAWDYSFETPDDIVITNVDVEMNAPSTLVLTQGAPLVAWVVYEEGPPAQEPSVVCTMPCNPCTDRLRITIRQDTECPRVRGVDDLAVALGSGGEPITVTFTKPMQLPAPSDVTIVPNVALTLGLDATSRVLSITPSTPLSPGPYEVTLHGTITDLAGNALNGVGDANSCGTPYAFDFCVEDTLFFACTPLGAEQTEFASNATLFASGRNFPANATFKVFLTRPEDLVPGAILIDETLDGPSTVGSNASGNLLPTAIGVAVRASEYVLVADMNNDGLYQSTDRAQSLCSSSLVVGVPCTDVDGFDDIVAFWPFDEATGAQATADLEGDENGSHPAVLVGGPASVQGQVSRAFAFNGTSQYLDVAAGPMLDFDVDDYSFGGWIMIPSTTGNRPILTKGDPSTSSGWDLRLLGGAPSARIRGATGTQIVTGPPLGVNSWHHIMVTVARGSLSGLKLYVDGSPVAFSSTLGVSGAVDNGVDLLFGKDAVASPSFFSGNLDEFGLFDAAVDPNDVAAQYQVGLHHGRCDSTVVASVPPPTPQPRLDEIMAWPNPFGAQMSLRYVLPLPQSVEVGVFDINGRLVRWLDRGFRAPGQHTLSWDGNSVSGGKVPPGIYLIRARLGPRSLMTRVTRYQ